MKETSIRSTSGTGRRLFMKKGLAAGTATMAGGLGLMAKALPLFGQGEDEEDVSAPITNGDAAMLRFAAAAEIIEADFWRQYNELGGVQDSEVPGGSGNPTYTAKLQNLDSDMPQYIHDNTDDEITHHNFLNAYLASKGEAPVSLEAFRTLPGSSATGASGRLWITNLMKLTIDNSWWTRYRSSTRNPDLDPTFKFPQAVPGLAAGPHTAIPRTDADLTPDAHIQAIANTAGFHFATIEQGGTTLYASMAQRATSVQVLRILISIGPTEAMHFQTWSDKAGNAVAPPNNVTDPTNGLKFPDLSKAGQLFKNNLIMPEPCPFLSRKLPKCSIIRPTNTQGIATGVVGFLTAMGLFAGQSKRFFAMMKGLAAQADAAQREC